MNLRQSNKPHTPTGDNIVVADAGNRDHQAISVLPRKVMVQTGHRLVEEFDIRILIRQPNSNGWMQRLKVDWQNRFIYISVEFFDLEAITGLIAEAIQEIKEPF